MSGLRPSDSWPNVRRLWTQGFIALGFACAVVCAPLTAGAQSDPELPRSSTAADGPKLISENCTPGVTANGSSIEFCGQINSQSLYKAKILLDSNKYTSLTITSLGGDSISAISLAELLNNQNIELKVRGYCFSACAHFVFMLSRNVEVDADAMVAFHQTSSFTHRFMEIKSEAWAENILRPAAIAEAEAYEKAHIDDSFLYLPAMLLRPLCIGALNIVKLDDLNAINLAQLVIPSREYIERTRKIAFSGWWPSNSEDVNRIAGIYRKQDGTKYSVVYYESLQDNPNREFIDNFLRGVYLCNRQNFRSLGL